LLLDVTAAFLKLRHSVIAELWFGDATNRVFDCVWSDVELNASFAASFQCTRVFGSTHFVVSPPQFIWCFTGLVIAGTQVDSPV
jgi:hypothetical protein